MNKRTVKAADKVNKPGRIKTNHFRPARIKIRNIEHYRLFTTDSDRGCFAQNSEKFSCNVTGVKVLQWRPSHRNYNEGADEREFPLIFFQRGFELIFGDLVLQWLM